MDQTTQARIKHLRTRRTVLAKQKLFLESKKRFTALFGGRGAGKSYCACLKALHLAGRFKCTGGFIAPTYPMVNDILLPLWLEIAGPVVEKHNRSSHTSFLLNGSKVMFRSADRPDRLRGLNWTWFGLDEAALVEEYMWLIAIATLRESGRTGVGFLTTTPRGKNHWIYDKFVTTQSPDYASWHIKTNDNLFTSTEFKHMVAREYGVGWFARQELLGEFCEPEGALFKQEWFKVVDPCDVPQDFYYTVRGWDLAATKKDTSDFTVGVKLGITEDGDIYVLDVVRMKSEWPDSRRRIIATAQQDGPECEIKIEDVAFQVVAVQEMRQEPSLFGYSITAAKNKGRDKLSHALPVASRAQAGKVYMVRAAWNSPYLAELCSFTGDGKDHDDQVDATSIAARGFIKPVKSEFMIL